MHGAPLQAEPAAAGISMKKLVESAARLRVVGDDAVRCRTPPTELQFIDELRAAVGTFARSRPDGISFSELKEHVKAVGRAKHTSVRFLKGGILGLVNNVLVPHVVQQYEPNGPFYATGFGGRTVAAAAGADAIAAAAAAPPVAFPSLPSTETLESLATFDGRRSPSAFTAISSRGASPESTFDAGHASPAVSEPAPPTPPKEREKRDSLLCDGDTVDAVLGSVFD